MRGKEMKRILMRVAYDGTDFCGWQRQPEKRTVEGVLNAALSHLLKEETEVIGASRTDSGVHAYGNIAVFDTESRIPPEKIAYAVNRVLPKDVRVMESVEVELDFHPRHIKTRKTYEYIITEREIPLPTERMYSYPLHGHLDLEKMRKAADALVGTHDFTSFCSVGTPIEDKVRTIYTVDINEKNLPGGGRELVIHVEGNGFLYNMVRIIAGTLVFIGFGRMEPEEIKTIIAAKDRQKAGPTAPPQGLFLVKIDILEKNHSAEF